MSVEDEFSALLRRGYEHAARWRGSLAERRVFPDFDPVRWRDELDGGGMPEHGADPAAVLELLARAGESGSTASAGPRYFGYVIGSSLPVAMAADWLVTAWDQNAVLYSSGPAVCLIEEVCARWLVDLLGLPPHTSVGFTTGTQMAHCTALAAARHHLLAARGWDVAADGLWGAPRIPMIAGEQRHASIDRALRLLGMGTRVRSVACDADGAMDVAALTAALDEARDEAPREAGAPPIVCVQAGSINTGAVDPIADVCDLVHARGGWVHVDGAIGLWALAGAEHRHLLRGAWRADSWTTDAHKWLNVPFDCGIAFLAHPAAHAAAMQTSADYLQTSGHRDQINTVPEWSRRARSVPLYAALRALGRAGVADLIDRNVAHARRIAERLAAEPGIEVINRVALNQVLVRFKAPPRDPDELTAEVIGRVQEEGTCWLSGSTAGRRTVMRISVCSWLTTAADIDRSAAAIIGCFRQVAAGDRPGGGEGDGGGNVPETE